MEKLLGEVGAGGRFQVQLVASFKLADMSLAWGMMQMTFAGLVPDWWCQPHGAANSSHGNWSRDNRTFHICPASNNSDKCGDVVFDDSVQTIVNEINFCSLVRVVYSGDTIGDGGLMTSSFVLTVVAYGLLNKLYQTGHRAALAIGMFQGSTWTPVTYNFTTIWTLVCGLDYVKPMMTSLQMGGVLFGALLGGQVSDSVGRRPTAYLTFLANLIVSLVAAFSVSWRMFAILRVLIGVTLGVNVVVLYSYMLEFIGSKRRQLVSAIPGWNIGILLFALMAWLFPNWSHLHMAVAVLNLPFLLTWFVFPESARWLAVKGRLQEAEAVISHLARVNRRQKPKDTLERLQEVMEEERKAGQGRRYTYIDVYRGWHMAVTSLVINFIWFCLSFCYYGISFGVSALSGNLYLNISLMVLVEIPVNLACVIFADRLGRKWTTFFLAILSSLSSFGILVSNFKAPETQQKTITTTLAMVSRLSVGAGWTVMNTFTLEQYPTVMRNLGFGAANTAARVGGVLAPLVINMDTDEEVVRGYIVVGILMGVSAFALLLLKETKGQDLRDSMTSVEVDNRTVNEPSGRTSSLDDDVPPMTGATMVMDVASAVVSRTGKTVPPTTREVKEQVEVKVEYD